jgi:hypothetical protein
MYAVENEDCEPYLSDLKGIYSPWTLFFYWNKEIRESFHPYKLILYHELCLSKIPQQHNYIPLNLFS